MTAEEKVLILGALFHDIGKFEQRCTGNPMKEKHPVLGSKLIDDGRFLQRFERIVGKENTSVLKNIISEHHNTGAKGLTSIVREADRLSASERVDKEETEVYQDQWNHKHLSSLFSKIKILSDKNIPPRYYKHSHLTKERFDVIIPSETTEKEIKEYAYKEYDWNLFKEDLEYVLDIFESDDDFESLINLLLVIFEKYIWCIPDFTGSSETDISLYNHLKDVAGLAHAIKLTQAENADSKKLNLVIGDIPGIQNYIFDVVNRKPAKILRGRSIFVQVLTRNLATKLLKTFGLTEVNLIMLAGGKFYIIAPDTKQFREKFEAVREEIEDYLFDNFRLEIGFNCAYHTFDYSDLMKKEKSLTFGQIVEEASHKLIQNRYTLFKNRLYNLQNDFKKNYIWEEDYINDDGSGTDSVKCRVTDKPIRAERNAFIEIPTDSGIEKLQVDKQVAIEYGIGSKIVGNDLIAVLDDNGLSIDPKNILSVKNFSNEKKYNDRIKILLNPTFNEQLKKRNLGKDVFRNTYYLEVANYCSHIGNDIMPFEDIVKENDGAKFLSLIKGDIDNLGLIMAYGLTSDKDDLTGISRTTTLSNHLKYYFSFFLNGFLCDWENKKQKEIELTAKQTNPEISNEELKKLTNENRVYTIFAGGDDLMLITPQSSAVKLIKALNDKFSEFSCSNDEIHISYSVTHFKDHTPIRIVADFAEENQKKGKTFTKLKQTKMLSGDEVKADAFTLENDKAGTFLFNTFIKNQELDNLIKIANELTEKSKGEKSGLSRGLIRRLLELSEMLKKYEETDDATYLITYARLNYTVNRLLKDKDKDIIKFFENVLTVNKEGNNEAQKIEKILYPLVCQVIYNIRN